MNGHAQQMNGHAQQMNGHAQQFEEEQMYQVSNAGPRPLPPPKKKYICKVTYISFFN